MVWKHFVLCNVPRLSVLGVQGQLKVTAGRRCIAQRKKLGVLAVLRALNMLNVKGLHHGLLNRARTTHSMAAVMQPALAQCLSPSFCIWINVCYVICLWLHVFDPHLEDTWFHIFENKIMHFEADSHQNEFICIFHCNMMKLIKTTSYSKSTLAEWSKNIVQVHIITKLAIIENMNYNLNIKN